MYTDELASIVNILNLQIFFSEHDDYSVYDGNGELIEYCNSYAQLMACLLRQAVTQVRLYSDCDVVLREIARANPPR